ncbi:hypothetical protein [Aeoliella sp. SH292]|uniref:hypothetical protein n=1 Tax=Aeoliella sp. SH292 TaxID=3454464 RepID=UPI003F9E32C3
MPEPNPNTASAKLRIARRSHWLDRSRDYHVQLDGRSLGTLNSGETLEFDIPPGSHSLEVRVGKCTSPLRMLNLKEGETVAFECGCRLKGWRALTAPWYLALARNKYLELKKVG